MTCNRMAIATSAALHERDCEPEGFRWIIVDDRAELGVRVDPVRRRWRTAHGGGVQLHAGAAPGLPHRPARRGRWREVLNTDSVMYGGSNAGNAGVVVAVKYLIHDLNFHLFQQVYALLFSCVVYILIHLQLLQK